MLVEVAGDDMFFQAISRTGKTVDSGVIQRQARAMIASWRMRPTGRQAASHRGARRVPRLSQFAVEHLLLLPLGAAIALVWANIRPGELFPFQLCDGVRGQRHRDGVLLRADDEGSRRSDRARRRASPMAARLLPVIVSFGVEAVPALLHISGWSTPLDEPMLGSAWPVTFATDLAVSYFVARLIFGRQHRRSRLSSCSAIASDALGFLALALFNPTRDLHLAGGAADARRRDGRRQRPATRRRQELLALSDRRPARCRGSRFTGAACIRRSPSCRSCRSCRTRRGIPAFSSTPRPEAQDTLSRFEVFWRYPAQLALFFFGLVNAGVPMGALGSGHLGAADRGAGWEASWHPPGAGVALLAGLHLPHDSAGGS